MNRKRIVSLLLALLMIFSMIPFSAFAESKVSDEEAAPFDETVEISEDHPEVEIIVEDAEPDDLTAEAPEETAEEEQPTEESEDGLTEMENTEGSGIEQDNSISDNPDPTKDESEWTDEKDETAELEQFADEDTDDDPQDEEQAEESPAEDPVQEQPEPSVEYADPWDEAISLFGHAYGRTKGETSVYGDADMMGDPVFFISQEDGILLATEYREQNSQKVLLVWCLSEDDIISGFVSCNTLKDDIMTDDADIAELRLLYDAFPVRTNAGDLYAFHVEGYTPIQESEVTEDIPDDEMLIDTDDPSTDPDEEAAPEEEVIDNEPEQETDSLDEPDPLDEPNQEEVYSITAGQIDDYIAVTTNTRAFMTMDESATDTYDGDYCLGYFVQDAVVQIAAIEQDEQGRAWYQVRYMFGDTYTDGSLKWTDYGFTWVLAQDTDETDVDACTVTDYALTAPPVKKKGMLKAATPTYGFSLRAAYGTMGSFYVGQYPLYGSSGSDSAYKQIAKLSGHGAVYATPHYLEGVPVYCLEHTYPGPGENKSSGGKQPTGPYIIVDIDSYMYNPGYSRIIYNKSTLHAIAWVLRHTYPFMVLDRYDADNDTWSRCAGQFAIREVIKQLEGPQYVRDYWDLNSFYTGSDQAPAEYLEYAKWLAYNGIARASITGYITEANKFMFTADGKYYGSVTLFTDADMIRIPCSVGSLTGNSLGSDGSYYYLNSGDTVVVASSVNGFSLYAESINSDTEEASFMIGVPDAQIQKVLIPIYGSPYPMQGISLWFEEETQYGSLTVTKMRDRGSMEALAGATFQLYDANGNAYGSPQTTGADGTVTWTQLPYGTYSVKETGAPTGYNVDLNQYQVTINGSNTLTVRNAPIIGSIQLVKKSKGTGIPLAGAEFELLTKSGNQYVRAVGADGNELPTVTTDAEGKAAWNDAVEYGEYFAHEIKAPEGYQLVEQYYAVGINQQAQVEIADAVDPIIQGKIRIVKTDADTGAALEGVEFSITQLSAPSSHGSNSEGLFSAALTTNKDGIAETGWLDWGQYQIIETKGPAHYADAHFSTTVDVTEHEKTYTVSVTNEQNKGYIHIVKTDAKNGTLLKGVVFDIYQGETLIGSMTTDQNGAATSEALTQGSYTVKEYANPEGYTGTLFTQECAVKADETVELNVINQPVQGKIKLLKLDALTKEPLAGVKFTVTKLTTSPAANGAGVGKVITLTTESDGTAETDWLDYGKYAIQEVEVPAHYVDQPFSTEITVTEDQKTYTITAENEPTKGKIQIIKTDKHDGQPIAGVAFDIYQGGKKVGSMTTDENGVAVSDALPKGQYTVKEHENPEGYVADPVSLDCEVKSDETTKLSADNTPIQFRIKILKTDSLTKQPLAGVEFTITRVSGLPSHNGAGVGEIVATRTTDANGEAVSDLLTWGVYEVKETKFPAHYVQNPFSVTITGTENNKVYEINAENEPTKGKIQITKTDKLDGLPIAGVMFDIYQGEKKVGSMTTNEKGIAVSDALPKGQYTVKEHESPEGYVADLVSLDCEVKSDETTKLVADNMPIQFRVKILKTDSLTKQPLTGAEFTIKRISALPSHGGVGNGDVVATLTTDANGEAVSDLLTWGRYEVTETKVPEHYVDNGFTATVTGAENNKTYTVTCENEPTKGWIRLVKTDSLDGHPIAGVQFDICQDGKIISTMTTDADGVAVSEPLPKGKYTVREHENPTGYTDALFSQDCDVFSDQTTDLIATNMPIQFRIKINKTDELTKEPISGAEFTIKRLSGLPSHGGDGDGDVVATLTTDANGEAITDLLTWGEYEIVESKVPLHYVDNHFSTSITGTEDQKTYEIRVENEPTKGWVQIIKTDALDRTPIEGVQFDLFYADDYGSGLAATMITDINGVAKSEPLRKGRYVVKEHAEPTGYVTDLVSLNCVIRSDETTELNATNQPIQGRIKVIKVDELTKEPLAGAEFTITRVSGLPSHKGSNDGEVVAVIATDAEGIALSPLLTWGTYQVEETGVPLHYVDNHFSAEVVIDQENLKTYEVYCENEPTKGWIRLTKTDRKNGNPIAGVQFDLYYNDQYGEGLACSMVTDEDGVAMSEPIRKGQYIVKEHGETAGYVFEEVTLTCTVHSDEITELTATNQPVQVKLKLFKRDKDEYTGDTADTPTTRGDGVLNGAAFQVLAGANIQDRQGNTIHEKGDIVIASLKTAGEDASVLTDELWPGLYEIVELSPPTGYQPSEEHFFVDTSDAAKQSKEAVIAYEGVKQNEILYGKHAIIKFLGDNLVHDDAGIVETPEPGAEFEVFLRSAGSYEAAREFERDYLITNASGYAVTKLLPYGIYTLRQTKGADGYAIKSPMDMIITGTEDLSSPPITIINNEAINYRIKITKIDAESGQPVALANTGFRLLDRDGVAVQQTVHYPSVQTIDTFYTDDSGEVTLPETVTYGLYFIEECKAPSGYLIPDGELPIFVGDSSMRDPGEVYLLEYTMANEPVLGKIILEKTGPQLVGFEAHTDAWDNDFQQPIYADRPLEGAVFEVYAAEDITGHDGTAWFAKDELVDTIITTADSRNETRELPLGKYYLIETSAPEGYFFDDTRYEANLEYLDDTTPLVEVIVRVKNDYLPAEISLRKEKEILEVVHDKDSITQRIGVDAGEGYVFGLFCQNDIRYADGTLMADTLIATGITDADGKLTFTGMYPHGRYYIKELAAADGWKLSAESFSVILSPDAKGSDNVIHAEVQEPIMNELIYSRITLTKTDITGQQTVPGAQIEVRESNENVIYRAFTDENGEIPNIPVIPGTYSFKEILAPEGYALYETEMQFSVDRDGNITGTTAVKDDYTRFTLLKKDADGKPLAGVEFGLIKGVGAPLFTAVSDETGIVTFEKIPYGTYSVVETKPLPGYIPNETAIRVQIDGTFVNPDMPIATVVNEPNKVLVKKIDQDGNALAGATFALCDAFGNRTATAVSGQDGIVRFERIPYGEYTIREIVAPNGYLLSKEVIDLTVDADYRNTGEPIATVVNKLKNLPFVKQNTAGQPMAGVSFSLLNATNGEVMETVTSNSKGEFSFKNFDYGLWIVHENKAPDGYNPMRDYSVSVDGSWAEPAAVILTNIPDHYEFLKTDNEGNPLAGVKFMLEDAEGNALQKLLSGEDGMVYVTGLVPGSYVIRETETLEGFTVSDDPIEITIDDSYFVADEIPVFVNYPVIQTGVDFEITPPMIAGAALIGAGGIGSVIMLLLW